MQDEQLIVCGGSRIEAEVLSVVSSQIQTIQEALKAGSARFLLKVCATSLPAGIVFKAACEQQLRLDPPERGKRAHVLPSIACKTSVHECM